MCGVVPAEWLVETAVPFSLGPQIWVDLFLYKLTLYAMNTDKGEALFSGVLYRLFLILRLSVYQHFSKSKIWQGASVAAGWRPNMSALLSGLSFIPVLLFHIFIYTSISCGKKKIDYFFNLINWQIFNVSCSSHILIFLILTLLSQLLPEKKKKKNNTEYKMTFNFSLV